MTRKSARAPVRAIARARSVYPQHAEISRLLPLYDIGGRAYFGYRMVLAGKLFDRRIIGILEESGILTPPPVARRLAARITRHRDGPVLWQMARRWTVPR